MGKRKTTEQFISEAKELHGDKYGYDKVEYINNKTKVIIVCPEHGTFEQSPTHHLNCGNGCPKCADSRKGQYRKLTAKGFIKKAKEIHGDKYDYSLVEYKGSQTNIAITCPIHNCIFEQTPANHLRGQGCYKCGRNRTTESAKENPTGWSYSNWDKAGKKSENFDGYKIYFVECWDEETEEKFYKIGRTYHTIKSRFKSVPYKYNIIYCVEYNNGKETCKAEQEYKNTHSKYKYTPKKEFAGMNECFSKIIKI